MGGAVQAADLGQYRPGNPYQSVMAPSADVCETHCTGDAQCRSWNYVKANPKASGVCEFNANDTAPVASAISISGSNQSPAYRQGIIPGGTNTIRVGMQPQPRPQAELYSQHTQQRSPLPSRRVVREPVPSQAPIQAASIERQRSLSGAAPRINGAQPEVMRAGGAATPHHARTMAIPQTFKYDLGDRPAPQTAHRPRPQTQNYPMSGPLKSEGQAYPPQYRPSESGGAQFARPSQPPQVRREQPDSPPRAERRRQQGPSVERAVAPPLVNRFTPQPGSHGSMAAQSQGPEQIQGQPFPPQSEYTSNAAPQLMRNQQAIQQQAMVRRSANDPVTYGGGPSQTSRLNPNSSPMQARNLAQGLSAEQAQQSLFGKLNDDVQVPNSGAAVPSDPNAPIPTMSSRVSGRVEQSNLAGGPN